MTAQVETSNGTTDAGSVVRTETVRVRIAGSDSTVKVVLKNGDTVETVLRGALEQLALPAETAKHLSPVVNGEDAKRTDEVPAGALVTASPRVSNG